MVRINLSIQEDIYDFEGSPMHISYREGRVAYVGPYLDVPSDSGMISLGGQLLYD